jgi:hypothetical protein
MFVRENAGALRKSLGRIARRYIRTNIIQLPAWRKARLTQTRYQRGESLRLLILRRMLNLGGNQIRLVERTGARVFLRFPRRTS